MIPKKSSFICPICRSSLFELEGSLKCLNSHSFDKAKQGYVNLLMKNSSGKRHGDDRMMLLSRREFLNKGYYERLRAAVREMAGEGKIIIDAGCGEGYYTSALSKGNTVCGIDISKEALRLASPKCPDAEFAVASISDIPIADGFADAVVNIFAPESDAEFKRILKREGRLITVMPMSRHLFALKAAVYASPIINPEPKTDREGFELSLAKEVKYEITLNSCEDIKALFKMTPYYYKTSASDQAKLDSQSSLTTDIEFLITEHTRL